VVRPKLTKEDKKEGLPSNVKKNGERWDIEWGRGKG